MAFFEKIIDLILLRPKRIRISEILECSTRFSQPKLIHSTSKIQSRHIHKRSTLFNSVFCPDSKSVIFIEE
jgi:hypothetical protein